MQGEKQRLFNFTFGGIMSEYCHPFGCRCNRCQNNRPPVFVVGARGPIGPQGPTGPQGVQGLQGEQGVTGPTGATGASGTGDGLYAEAVNGDVTAETVISLTQSTATPETTMSVSGNVITVPAGTYLISYSVTARLPSANDVLSVSLLENGTAIDTESTDVSIAANPANVSGTILRTTTAATEFSLENTSSVTATIAEGGITLLKIV